jgi:hypothetical protein
MGLMLSHLTKCILGTCLYFRLPTQSNTCVHYVGCSRFEASSI